LEQKMAIFEYKVIPAPLSGKKAKGVKGADGRFANALAESINELAASGWEYVRSESLPSVERHGVMRKRREVYQNVLVFRRDTDAEVPEKTEDTSEGFNPFKRFSSKKEPVVTEDVKPKVDVDSPDVETETDVDVDVEETAKSDS
jgi:hypothetical protein